MAKIADPDDLDPAGTAEIETDLLEIKQSSYIGVPFTPGSKTSIIAAWRTSKTVANQREEIWLYIYSRGEDGATFDETRLDLEYNYYSSTRFAELRRLGRIRKTNRTRETEAGNPAAVYVAVDPKQWKDKRTGWPTPRRPSSTRSDKSRLRFAAKSFCEILERIESGGLFALTEVEGIATVALAVLG